MTDRNKLREQCEPVLEKVFDACGYNEDSGAITCNLKKATDALEAFAREQQIKGMERCKDIIKHHHARVWLAEQIDAEIKKLKEGK